MTNQEKEFRVKCDALHTAVLAGKEGGLKFVDIHIFPANSYTLGLAELTIQRTVTVFEPDDAKATHQKAREKIEKSVEPVLDYAREMLSTGIETFVRLHFAFSETEESKIVYTVKVGDIWS